MVQDIGRSPGVRASFPFLTSTVGLPSTKSDDISEPRIERNVQLLVVGRGNTKVKLRIIGLVANIAARELKWLPSVLIAWAQRIGLGRCQNVTFLCFEIAQDERIGRSLYPGLRWSHSCPSRHLV